MWGQEEQVKHRDFSGSETILHDTVMIDIDIMHLPKSTERHETKSEA